MEYKNRVISTFYRDKQILLAVEDAMTNKLDKSLYKIAFKLVPQDQNNKAKKEEILIHYLDVSEAKRIAHHYINKGTFKYLYNNTEQTKNGKVDCYKDMKGGLSNGRIQSRIFTLLENNDGSTIIQLTIHEGRKYGQGAIIPTSGPKKRLYIKLSRAEIEELVLELNDYIRNKELYQFPYYHPVEIQSNVEKNQNNFFF
ncbi:hypothetical protein [Calidifontibacillus erzurumensis]|uniref:hypothetical protein n=1 Tax=Calidifontibacillus erzurumensis TaxID=2741433 RepID=UPI0035B527DE